MKPGQIIVVKCGKKWRKATSLHCNDLEEIIQGKRHAKEVPNGVIGFVVKQTELKIFDYLVQVAFPDLNLQGWVSKEDLQPVNRSELEDHLAHEAE